MKYRLWSAILCAPFLLFLAVSYVLWLLDDPATALIFLAGLLTICGFIAGVGMFIVCGIEEHYEQEYGKTRRKNP